MQYNFNFRLDIYFKIENDIYDAFTTNYNKVTEFLFMIHFVSHNI